MEFWTHNKTMFIFIALNGFVTKSYMDMYVSNQWTHGQLDAQKNNVSLFIVYPRLEQAEITLHQNHSLTIAMLCFN